MSEEKQVKIYLLARDEAMAVTAVKGARGYYLVVKINDKRKRIPLDLYEMLRLLNDIRRSLEELGLEGLFLPNTRRA